MKSLCPLAALILVVACDRPEPSATVQSPQIDVQEPSEQQKAKGWREEAERRGAEDAKKTLAQDANATGSSDGSVIPPIEN